MLEYSLIKGTTSLWRSLSSLILGKKTFNVVIDTPPEGGEIKGDVTHSPTSRPTSPTSSDDSTSLFEDHGFFDFRNSGALCHINELTYSGSVKERPFSRPRHHRRCRSDVYINRLEMIQIQKYLSLSSQ